MKSYSVMSLDISSTCTGWSFTSNKANLIVGRIQPKEGDMAQRLTEFRSSLKKVLKKYKPKEVVIEDTFVGKNPKVTKTLAKFGGVAEQLIFECCGFSPYVMSNTTPKSFFKAKTKRALYDIMIDLVEFEEENMSFNKWNDVTDSVAQLFCYCDDVLKIKKFRKEEDYGYDFN